MNHACFDVPAGAVAHAVLPRVVGALGAQADLPLDRIHDCVVTVDAMLACVEGDRVIARAGVAIDGIEILIGPLPPTRADGATSPTALGAPGVVVVALSDRAWIDHDGASPAVGTFLSARHR